MNRRQVINKILHLHIDVNKYEDYTNYKKLITAIEEWHESEVKKLPIHNVVRCASCDNNDDFSETGKQEICIEGEYRYVTATTCNKCGKAVEIDFFD